MNSTLTALGSNIVVFDEDGDTERWLYERDEVLYVIAGNVELTIFEIGETTTLCGSTGDLFQIARGSDLQYRATAGTRILLAFAPLQ